MTKKKVKVRVKKRKLKIGRILLCLLVLVLIGVFFYFIRKLPIKNIYIIGNNIVPESDILDLSGIKNYPSFIDTSSSKITFYAPTKPKSTVVLILLKPHLLHQ